MKPFEEQCKILILRDLFVFVFDSFLLFLWGVVFVFVFVFALPADIAVNIFTLTKENAMTLHCNIETNVTQEISSY